VIGRLVYGMQEVTADTLTELYISYNFIEKMKGINALKKLKVPCTSADIQGGPKI